MTNIKLLFTYKNIEAITSNHKLTLGDCKMQIASVSLADKISSYDFSSVVAHAAKENPELVPLLSAALTEYKAFMQLSVECAGVKLAVPSKVVDAIWHSHILHTREYLQFCRSLGVDFIHHSPHSATTTKEEKEQTMQNLIAASVRLFGSNVFHTVAQSDCDDCNVDVDCSSSCDGSSDDG